MGIFFGITYAILTALGKVSLKQSHAELPSSVAFFLETIFGLILWIPFGLLYGVEFHEIPRAIPIVFISAILSEAYIFYIYSRGNISLIASVFSTYSIYTVIFSSILLGERINLTGYLSIGLMIVGILTLSLPKKADAKKIHSLAPILWGTSGAIAVGLSDTLSKSIIDNTSTGTFLFLLALTQLPISIIYLYMERQNPKLIFVVKKEFPKYKYSFFAGLLIAIGMIFFWLSFEFTLASIASPITSTSVMFTVLFALTLLKEQLTRKDYIGIVLVLVSLFSINIFT